MFDATENLGRLKHTTKDNCPDCNQSKIQLRVRVSDGGVDEEYLYCPKCDYEARPKKSKTEGIWKKQIVAREAVEYEQTNLQSRANPKRDGKDSRTGNKRFDKRNSGKI